MRRLALAVVAISGHAAALLSSSVATQREYDSDMAPQEPEYASRLNELASRIKAKEVPEGQRLSDWTSKELKIPLQLVLTAKEGTLDDLPRKQRANVERTLALNPELVVRFLNDKACEEFIDRNYGDELSNAFKHETVGYFRGDICRAAVIAIEGGFYADLDVQFKVPFSEMVDSGTTFMSAFDSFCNLWNAIFAAEPQSTVMHAVIDSMKSWYNGTMDTSGLMGTKTFYDGLNNVVKRDCLNKGRGSGDVHFKARRKLQFQCGNHNQFRLYREMPLDCGSNKTKRDAEECPDARVNGFWGLRFGIYEPGVVNGAGTTGKLVGWSRYEDCSYFGCNERRSALAPPSGTDNERVADPEQRELRPASHCP